MSDYERIEKAITYLADHAAEQPDLDEVAAHVHLSPFHFQRLFTRWAGTTPKRFLQVLTVERGKYLLEDSRSLLEASHHLGLSGSSRLHDHFVTLEAVTPGEYRSKGKDVRIDYGVHDTRFGPLFVAATARGICRAGFVDFVPVDEQIAELRKVWPLADLNPDQRRTAPVARMIDGGSNDDTATDQPQGPLSLHVAGTNFQVAVWRALLKIPEGTLASYSQLAAAVDRPGASRAVGNAVGANPIAFLIPCHRVIQQSGALGGYRWGPVKKQAMQLWEQLRSQPDMLES